MKKDTINLRASLNTVCFNTKEERYIMPTKLARAIGGLGYSLFTTAISKMGIETFNVYITPPDAIDNRSGQTVKAIRLSDLGLMLRGVFLRSKAMNDNESFRLAVAEYQIECRAMGATLDPEFVEKYFITPTMACNIKIWEDEAVQKNAKKYNASIEDVKGMFENLCDLEKRVEDYKSAIERMQKELPGIESQSQQIREDIKRNL